LKRRARILGIRKELLSVILAASILSSTLFGVVKAASPNPQVPPGFQLLVSVIGVQLYRKDYPNGNPDFVQLIDLTQGAAVRLLHAPISEQRTGQGVYGGDDPRFTSIPLGSFWQQLTTAEKNAFCVVNGSFFYMPEFPTRLAFPLKVDGTVITDGWGINTYPDQKLMLELWGDHSDIQALNKDALYSSTAPDIIAGLSEEANKRANRSVARTFIGIEDRDGDGAFETVLILNTLSALQTDAADVLRSFGAAKVMMLDGGGSTQLECKSGWYIKSDRVIPQAIAVVAGIPPLVAMQLVRKPVYPVLVEGEYFPFEVEIKNTGTVDWTADKTQLVLYDSSLGSQEQLPLRSDVKVGDTAIFTNSLAAYSASGVFPVSIPWGLDYDGKVYHSQPITATAIVLPEKLKDNRVEMQDQVSQWIKDQPDKVNELAAKWIEVRSNINLSLLTSPAVIGINLNDALWVPIIMLPVVALIAALIVKTRHGK